MTRLLPILAVSFLVVGCAGKAPERQAPDTGIETPTAWDATDQVRTSVDWLEEDFLSDPLLRQVVQRTWMHNPSLHAAEARIRAAAAAAEIAGADQLPQASVGTSAGRRRFMGPTGPTRANSFGLSLDVSWELDVWGRIAAGESAAIADMQALEADYQRAYESLGAQAVKAYFSWLESLLQQRLAAETAASYAESAGWIAERYELGVRPPLDVRLSRAQLASAEASQQRRAAEVDALSRQLAVLMGAYPSRELMDEAMAPGEMPGLASAVPGGLPADIIARRPDLQAAERRYAAAVQRIDAAEANRYPRIALTGSAGFASDDLNSLLDLDSAVWNLLGNLTQPIFQGGRIEAGIDAAEANADAARYAFVQTALAAYGEVETALAAEEFLAAQQRHVTEAAEQSQAAAALAMERYREGLSDVITMLESQRRAFDAQSQLLTIQRSRLQNRINLYLALGGAFELPSDAALSPTPS